MKPRVQVPPEWMARSRQWAERSIAGYGAGEKEGSRQYSYRGIDKDLDKQSFSRAGEVACCLYFRVEPERLNWSAHPDSGWDIRLFGRLVDVKTTDGNCLLWPKSKNSFLAQHRAEVLLLVSRVEPDLFEMTGWCTLAHFIAHHATAPPPAWLDAGTKHLRDWELWDVRHMARAGCVTYDGEHFVHYCHCGREGMFGFDVSLRKNQPGQWYCAEHKPRAS